MKPKEYWYVDCMVTDTSQCKPDYGLDGNVSLPTRLYYYSDIVSLISGKGFS